MAIKSWGHSDPSCRHPPSRHALFKVERRSIQKERNAKEKRCHPQWGSYLNSLTKIGKNSQHNGGGGEIGKIGRKRSPAMTGKDMDEE